MQNIIESWCPGSLKCAVVRGRYSLLGYVGVGPSHPLFGATDKGRGLSVPGFSREITGTFLENNPEAPNDPTYWLGFDLATLDLEVSGKNFDLWTAIKYTSELAAKLQQVG